MDCSALSQVPSSSQGTAETRQPLLLRISFILQNLFLEQNDNLLYIFILCIILQLQNAQMNTFFNALSVLACLSTILYYMFFFLGAVIQINKLSRILFLPKRWVYLISQAVQMSNFTEDLREIPKVRGAHSSCLYPLYQKLVSNYHVSTFIKKVLIMCAIFCFMKNGIYQAAAVLIINLVFLSEMVIIQPYKKISKFVVRFLSDLIYILIFCLIIASECIYQRFQQQIVIENHHIKQFKAIGVCIFALIIAYLGIGLLS